MLRGTNGMLKIEAQHINFLVIFDELVIQTIIVSQICHLTQRNCHESIVLDTSNANIFQYKTNF